MNDELEEKGREKRTMSEQTLNYERRKGHYWGSEPLVGSFSLLCQFSAQRLSFSVGFSFFGWVERSVGLPASDV